MQERAPGKMYTLQLRRIKQEKVRELRKIRNNISFYNFICICKVRKKLLNGFSWFHSPVFICHLRADLGSSGGFKVLNNTCITRFIIYNTFYLLVPSFRLVLHSHFCLNKKIESETIFYYRPLSRTFLTWVAWLGMVLTRNELLGYTPKWFCKKLLEVLCFTLKIKDL